MVPVFPVFIGSPATSNPLWMVRLLPAASISISILLLLVACHQESLQQVAPHVWFGGVLCRISFPSPSRFMSKDWKWTSSPRKCVNHYWVLSNSTMRRKLAIISMIHSNTSCPKKFLFTSFVTPLLTMMFRSSGRTCAILTCCIILPSLIFGRKMKAKYFKECRCLMLLASIGSLGRKRQKMFARSRLQSLGWAKCVSIPRNAH